MKKHFFFALTFIVAGNVMAQTHSLDFTDPSWKNQTSGRSSEFKSNDAGRGNDAGWNSPHRITNIDGSGIDATLELSHQPHAWNIENRPSLAPYFPSKYGNSGDILRIWNKTGNIPADELPSVTLTFNQSVSLFSLGLEGYRHDDAWKVQAFDENGMLVAPNWANPGGITYTKPGDALSNTAINILTTERAGGVEAESSARFSKEDSAYYVWNKNNVFERGATVINYNGAEVKSLRYTMIEVNTKDGTPTGDPSDQSMYIGSGLVFVPVPEPSSTALLGLGGLAMIMRRRR